MNNDELKTLKELYQTNAGISDEELLEEAIVTLENYLLLKDKNELYHCSRVEVIAYLALLEQHKVK